MTAEVEQTTLKESTSDNESRIKETTTTSRPEQDSGISSFLEEKEEPATVMVESHLTRSPVKTSPLNEVNILKRSYSEDVTIAGVKSFMNKRPALASNGNLPSSHFANDLFVQKETYDDSRCNGLIDHDFRADPPGLNHLIKRIDAGGPESDSLIIKKIVDNQNRIVNTSKSDDTYDGSRLKELNISKEGANNTMSVKDGKRSSTDLGSDPVKLDFLHDVADCDANQFEANKSTKFAKRFKQELFKKKHLFDQILITDVTAHNTTITVRECKSVKAFFKDRNGKKTLLVSNSTSTAS